MTNPFEFTLAQNLFAGRRAPGPKWFGRRLWPGYDLPFCDANLTRALDTTEVGTLATTPAFEEHHLDFSPRMNPGEKSTILTAHPPR